MCLLSDVLGGALRGSRYLDVRRGTYADFRFYSFHVLRDSVYACANYTHALETVRARRGSWVCAKSTRACGGTDLERADSRPAL